MRRTKIVCTLGPACETVETMREMIKAGMNVARLNFSHGSHEEHLKRVRNVRQAARDLGVEIALMLDTKGPEIRSGMLKTGAIELIAGQKFTLTTEEILGDASRVSVSYKNLHNELYPGARILMSDGLIELKVEKTEGTEIHTTVVNGGPLGNRKNMNLPGIKVNLPAVTEKDIEDFKFAVEHDFDFIAASFIRKTSDVIEIRSKLEDLHGLDIMIIAKIENAEGVENIDGIIHAADGIMVARGDLGSEIPSEQVPIVQKAIIKKCNKAGKPVITATQMLESMIHNPRPTRAEASDVANAIFDGTDATMLSGESAAGAYPVETVRTMARIAETTENSLEFERILNSFDTPEATITDAICHSTCRVALDLEAEAIITLTHSGYTALEVSKYRPKAPIIAVTSVKSVVRKLMLSFGVFPVYAEDERNTDKMIDLAVQVAIENKLIQEGDLVVITAGVPVGIAGTTNMLKVQMTGHVLLRGNGLGKDCYTGKVLAARTLAEAEANMEDGAVLVVSKTDESWEPIFARAGAIIAEQSGAISPVAIYHHHHKVPAIVEAQDALEKLQTDMIVTLDCIRGHVLRGKVRVM